MTIITLCALAPHLCRMAEDTAVRRAVSAFTRDESEAQYGALTLALRAHPEDAAAAISLLGGNGLSIDSISQCFNHEALAFFHICGQCSASELLLVLYACINPPTMEALALLISNHRRQQAMVRYALQMLWRICGDDTLPDALSLFPEERNSPARGDLVQTFRRMKGGTANG